MKNFNRRRTADMIRTKREGLGLTQVQVAEHVRNRGIASCSETHFRRIENAECVPNVLLAMEIASIIDADVYEIWS